MLAHPGKKMEADGEPEEEFELLPVSCRHIPCGDISSYDITVSEEGTPPHHDHFPPLFYVAGARG